MIMLCLWKHFVLVEVFADTLSHVIFAQILFDMRGRYYYLCITDGEIEAQT